MHLTHSYTYANGSYEGEWLGGWHNKNNENNERQQLEAAWSQPTLLRREIARRTHTEIHLHHRAKQ